MNEGEINEDARGRERTRSRSATNPRKLYKNPFMNFVQVYRLNRPGRRASEYAKDAGKAWRAMSEDQKSMYVNMAKNAPKKRRRSKSKRRRRQRRRRRRI